MSEFFLSNLASGNLAEAKKYAKLPLHKFLLMKEERSILENSRQFFEYYQNLSPECEEYYKATIIAIYIKYIQNISKVTQQEIERSITYARSLKEAEREIFLPLSVFNLVKYYVFNNKHNKALQLLVELRKEIKQPNYRAKIHLLSGQIYNQLHNLSAA